MKNLIKKSMKVLATVVAMAMVIVCAVVAGIKISDWMAYNEDMTQWIEATGEEMDDEMKNVYEKYGINVCLVLHDIQKEAEENRARYKYEFTQKSNGQMYLTCNIEGQREPIVYEILKTVD